MVSIDFEPTPNPNSLKFTASGRAFIPSGMESFNAAEQAAGHPLGAPLFEIEGVTNVFVLPQFLTVTKRPDADWDDVIPAIEGVLQSHFDGSGQP
ncbi:MAG TPA: NifU N-terminal domain-containing protein [Rhodothermales bacterium]|nr:NifU N-terminal domain-containing protein [Rhodothermales bacterium]